MQAIVASARTSRPSEAPSTTSVDVYVEEAKACNSPKLFRIYLEEYEATKRSESEQILMKVAMGWLGASYLASAVYRVPADVKQCVQTKWPLAAVACGRCMGSMLGATLGAAGVVLAGYLIALGQSNVAKFTAGKDDELKQMFQARLEREGKQSAAQRLMTRYSALAYADRAAVREALFQAYLLEKDQ